MRQKCSLRPLISMSVAQPIAGCVQLNVEVITSVAFCPVVTIAIHCGICSRSAGMSVGVTTSRNLSDAFSFSLTTSHAVSYSAIPFSWQNSSMALLFFSLYFEMVPVAEEYVAEDTPHVIYPVRIEEFHAPPSLWWRETAEHKDFRVLGQERL